MLKRSYILYSSSLAGWVWNYHQWKSLSVILCVSYIHLLRTVQGVISNESLWWKYCSNWWLSGKYRCLVICLVLSHLWFRDIQYINIFQRRMWKSTYRESRQVGVKDVPPILTLMLLCCNSSHSKSCIWSSLDVSLCLHALKTYTIRKADRVGDEWPELPSIGWL